MEVNSKILPVTQAVNPEGVIQNNLVQNVQLNPYQSLSNFSYVPANVGNYYYQNSYLPANYVQVPNINYSYPIQYVMPSFYQQPQPSYYPNIQNIQPEFAQSQIPPQYERIQPAEPKGFLGSFFDKIYTKLTGKTRTNWRDIENAKFIAPPKARIIAGNLEYTYKNTKVKKIPSPRRVNPMDFSPRRVRALTPQQSLNQGSYGFDFPKVEKGSFFDA